MSYNLTVPERKFIKHYLIRCGVRVFDDLANENYTSMNIRELIDEEYDLHTTNRFIKVLEDKNIIVSITGNKPSDLVTYWINEPFIEAVIASGQGDVDLEYLRLGGL